MRKIQKLLITCRECYLATLFVLALFVAQGIQWRMQLHEHNFALPAVMRLFDFHF